GNPGTDWRRQSRRVGPAILRRRLRGTLDPSDRHRGQTGNCTAGTGRGRIRPEPAPAVRRRAAREGSRRRSGFESGASDAYSCSASWIIAFIVIIGIGPRQWVGPDLPDNPARGCEKAEDPAGYATRDFRRPGRSKGSSKGSSLQRAESGGIS